MRILMLSSTFPYPPTLGGTEIRTFNLLKYLQQHHDVTLITQSSPQVDGEDIKALRQWVSQLIVLPLPPEQIGGLVQKARRFLTALARATPPNVLHRYSPEIQAWVDDYVAQGNCDVITCEHSVNEIYIRPEFRQRVRTVVDIHSSLSAWSAGHLAQGASPYPLRDRLYLNLLLKRYERRYCRKFTDIVVTTEDDRQAFLGLRPELDIQVVPNGVDLAVYPLRAQDPGGHRLVFVGVMDAEHNIAAARFFVTEVVPKLLARYPNLIFSIVGAKPTAAVKAMGLQPGVVVTGKVASMKDALHQATVCVVPLQTGLGIKNKTLEAMAAGVPVVGSDRGLEGLDIDGGGDGGGAMRALRANSPAEYVAAIERLFEDGALRQTLSTQAHDYVAQTFTWDIAGQRYAQILAGG
jgi:polysaccharide biosynthesis protein PslH